MSQFEFDLISVLERINKQLEMMNLITLEKWDNKIEGYDRELNDRETRGAVREGIQFFQSYFQHYLKAQNDFAKKKEKEWERKNLR
jgi:hypothetical protein